MTGSQRAAASNKDLQIRVPEEDQDKNTNMPAVTPSTPELRNRMGVNSPRLKHKQEATNGDKQQEQYYDEDEYDDEYYDDEAGATTVGYHQQQQQNSNGAAAGGSSGLDALVTQVSRDGQPAMAAPSANSRPVRKGPQRPSHPKPKSKGADSDAAPSPQQQAPPPTKKRLSGLARLCSCFMPKRPKKNVEDIDESTPAPPEAELAAPLDDNSSSRRSSTSSMDDQYGESLLGPRMPENRHKKTLVLDLDETLVHSSFKPVPNPDFIVPITIDNNVHQVYVMKRPGVDEFMQKVCQKYEIVLFTASLSKYANPLLDILDPAKTIDARLFREACVMHCGTYVKDMSLLGRKLRNTIIVDNSPQSYAFHPTNAVPISSWFDDRSDRQLYDLLPLLNYLAEVEDVRDSLDANKPIDWLLHEFKEKDKEEQEEAAYAMHAQQQQQPQHMGGRPQIHA